MAYERVKVLIVAKTYPELSAKYTETVCTAGVREDGRPIRLYPVPLRYLEDAHHYGLYNWIELPVEKSGSDPRPESFRVIGEHIARLDSVDTDRATWRRRREAVFRDTTWHFGSVDALKRAQQESGRSLGLVTPGAIEDVRIVPKPESARVEYEAKRAEVTLARDLFRPEYKRLDYLPNDVVLEWRCADECACKGNPHAMKVLDWGLLELARRDGWDRALHRMQGITNLREHEFKPYMGNFRLHQKTFGIIGMWYPKIQAQASLFD